MDYLRKHFGSLTSFYTSCAQIVANEYCDFKPFPTVDDPLIIGSDLTATCFSVHTTAGNEDIGPDATARFSTYERDGLIYLNVSATAPHANWVAEVGSRLFTPNFLWGQLADNLGQALYPSSESESSIPTPMGPIGPGGGWSPIAP